MKLEDPVTKEDVENLKRLQKELLEKEGIKATLQQCYNIWDTYSHDLAASWLFFPENNIVEMIKTSDYFDSFENYME